MADITESRKTDELIEHIYAAMLGEQSWQQLLVELTSDLPAGKAAMQMFNYQQPSASGVALQTGFDEASLKAYTAHYCAENMLQKSLALRSDGIAYADLELVAPDQLRSSPFFNEWLAPGGVRASAGVRIAAEGAWSFTLTLNSEQGSGDIRQKMVKRLAHLAPHLRRAGRFYRAQADDAVQGSLGKNLLESAGAGVIVVDRDLRIQAVNARAVSQLDTGTLPLRITQSRLGVKAEDISAVIQQMLSPAYCGPGAMTLAMPGGRISLARVTREGMSLLFNGISIILLIETRHSAPLFDEEVFALEHGLTAAEVRAARGIVQGLTPESIALQAGLSRETIRVQIRSLYSKIGASSQADVLRLITLRQLH